MKHLARKILRLSGWDYGKPGPYFITLCTHQCLPIFNNESVRQAVTRAVRETATLYGATIHALCVAEDHVHVLVSLAEDSRVGLSQLVGATRVRITQTLRVGKPTPTRPVWQRSFYDHIIRNDADFQEKARYIENHPLKEPGTVFAEWH